MLAPRGHIEEILLTVQILATSPLMGRPDKGGKRELVIGRASRGYVALYRYAASIDGRSRSLQAVRTVPISANTLDYGQSKRTSHRLPREVRCRFFYDGKLHLGTCALALTR